jgi:hypothetical protein
MKNYIALMFVLIMLVEPVRALVPITSQVTVIDNVIMGNTLPRYGVLCEDTNVQGNPHDGFATLYTLQKGETVRLREPGGDGHAWVMIAPAQWIRITALCQR